MKYKHHNNYHVYKALKTRVMKLDKLKFKIS